MLVLVQRISPGKKQAKKGCGTKKHSIWHYFYRIWRWPKKSAASQMLSIPLGPSQKGLLWKVCNFVDKVEKTVLRGVGWVPLELAPKSRKKPIGALSCMHKGPKCFQSLWDHPKKIPFVQKHKEGAICAEKTPFLAFPEAKKGVGNCARLRKAAILRRSQKKPHFWPSQRLKKVLLTVQGCARLRTGLIITQIPWGYQKKEFIV